METIFSEILTRLKTVTDLKYIGLDEGQIDGLTDEDSLYNVFFPAALIEIETINWTTLLNPAQNGNAVLTVRFAWLAINRFDSNESATRLNEALARWAVHSKISKTLHGFSGTNFGPLERITTEKEKREGRLKVMNISFSLNINEDLTPV